MKDQHSISFLLLNHLHTSTLLVIDNFISQLPCNLEDLQYVRNIKVNVRGVLVAHVVALTLCAAAAVRSAPLSPPHCFQQHWRHRRLAALSPLSTCLEDLQYVRNIKVNVRGVLVAHVVALTLCAAAAVRSAPLTFSSPFCFQQHWRHRRLAALSPLYLSRWWTHTSPATPYIHPSVCTYYRAGGFVFFSRAGSINAAGPLFPTMFVLVITNIYLLSRQHIMLVVA